MFDIVLICFFEEIGRLNGSLQNSSFVYILMHGREEWVLYSLVPDYLSVSCDYEAMNISFDTVPNLSMNDALLSL